MNADDSAQDVSHTDWVTAAMAGRGSGAPPLLPPAGNGGQLDSLGAVVVEAIFFIVLNGVALLLWR